MARTDRPLPDLAPLPDPSRRPDPRRTARRALLLLVGFIIAVIGMCYSGWVLYTHQLQP